MEKEKDREKEKVRDRTAKLNDKNSDRELKQGIKSKGHICCLKNNLKILYTR